MAGKVLLLFLPLFVISPPGGEQIALGPSKNVPKLPSNGIKLLSPSFNPGQNKKTLGVNLAMKGGAPDFDAYMEQKKRVQQLKNEEQPEPASEIRPQPSVEDHSKSPKPMVREFFGPMIDQKNRPNLQPNPRPHLNSRNIFRGKFLNHPATIFPFLQPKFPEIKPEFPEIKPEPSEIKPEFEAEPKVEPENYVLPSDIDSEEKIDSVIEDDKDKSPQIIPSEEKKPSLIFPDDEDFFYDNPPFENPSDGKLSPFKQPDEESQSPIKPNLDKSGSDINPFEVDQGDLDISEKLPLEEPKKEVDIIKKEEEYLKKVLEDVKRDKSKTVVKRTVIVLENFGCSKCKEGKKLRKVNQAFQ